MTDHSFLDKLETFPISVIQIDGSDQRFECIAIYIVVVRVWANGGNGHLVEPHFEGYTVQGFALYDFRAYAGQKTFFFVRKMFV